MRIDKEKNRIKQELKRLFKSMDFICDNYLTTKEDVPEKDIEAFADIYQQLGVAWEFLGLQCRHWDGYRRTRDKKEACKICGKIRGTDEMHILLPKNGHKKVGRKQRPSSKKTFRNKKEATILDDTINFHGARLNVDVHNSYKSKLFGSKHEINIAAERTVKLTERGIECYLDEHLIYIKMGKIDKKGKKEYGGFPWELRKKDLKNFPVIFDFDENHRFLGLTILK